MEWQTKKPKNIWAIGIVLSFVLAIFGAANSCNKFPFTFSPVDQTYTDTSYGFIISYPQGWKIVEEGLQAAQDTSNYGNSHMPTQFIQPQRCNVSVEILELSYMAQTFEEWSQDVISPSESYIHILQSGNTFLSSYPAYQVTETDSRQKIEDIKVWALVNGKIYLVQGTVFQRTQFSDYVPTIQQMVDSFTIYNSQTSN